MSPCANQLISKRPDFGCLSLALLYLFIRCHEIYIYIFLTISLLLGDILFTTLNR